MGWARDEEERCTMEQSCLEWYPVGKESPLGRSPTGGVILFHPDRTVLATERNASFTGPKELKAETDGRHATIRHKATRVWRTDQPSI